MQVCVRDGMKAHLGTGPSDARVYDGDFRLEGGKRQVIDMPERLIYNRNGKAGSALMLPNGEDVPDLEPKAAQKMHEKWTADLKAGEKASKAGKPKTAPDATFGAPRVLGAGGGVTDSAAEAQLAQANERLAQLKAENEALKAAKPSEDPAPGGGKK